MKLKRWIALALTAVMAFTMLTACGSSNGVSGSLSNNEINSLLEDVGSDIEVETDSSLNNAVRAAARTVVSTGSTSAVTQTVSDNMGWSIANIFTDFIRNLLNGGGLLGTEASYGVTYAIEESRLLSNTGTGILGSLGSNRDKIVKLGDINTPEKFAAAQILLVDGTIGQLDEASNGIIRFTYNVSGCKAKTENGTTYWIFAAQVTVHLL